MVPEMIDRVTIVEGEKVILMLDPTVQEALARSWLLHVDKLSWYLLPRAGRRRAEGKDATSYTLKTIHCLFSDVLELRTWSSVVHVSCPLSSLPVVMSLVS